MYIIQLSDYNLNQDDIIPGVLVQGDIGQVYDSVAFQDFLNNNDEISREEWQEAQALAYATDFPN